MKINYKLVLPCEEGFYSEYHEVTRDNCCTQMGNWIKYEYAAFGGEYLRCPNMYLLRKYSDWDGIETEYERIDFCMFCGEEIKCQQVATYQKVAKTIEVDRIVKETKTVITEVLVLEADAK